MEPSASFVRSHLSGLAVARLVKAKLNYGLCNILLDAKYTMAFRVEGQRSGAHNS